MTTLVAVKCTQPACTHGTHVPEPLVDAYLCGSDAVRVPPDPARPTRGACAAVQGGGGVSAEILRRAASEIREEWSEDRAMGQDRTEWRTWRAVADWLDAVAEVHWPKQMSTRSASHYNADPEHDQWADCDETCWRDAFVCNGCGTTNCRPEVGPAALAVAHAYLGTTA